MNLDEKLDRILYEHRNDSPMGKQTPLIEDLKAAFSEAGYKQLPKQADMQSLVDAGLAEFMMTGQEWYDRFTRELPPPLHEPQEHAEMFERLDVLSAARRAAGLEEA